MGAANPRRRLLLCLAFLLPVGLASKLIPGQWAWWIRDYGGGVLYVVFWTLVLAALRLDWRRRTVVLTVLAITCSLEFLQLWHPAPLEAVRATFVGHGLLGSTFSWWDFPHYLLGSLIATAILAPRWDSAP
jgi:hypothetical protein